MARESSEIVAPLVWSAKERERGESEGLGSFASPQGHPWGFAGGRAGTGRGLQEVLAADGFRKVAVYGSSKGKSPSERTCQRKAS